MATILVNTSINFTELYSTIWQDLHDNMPVQYSMIDYSEESRAKIAEAFPQASPEEIEWFVSAAKDRGHFLDDLLNAILPIDLRKNRVRFIFGKFSEKEWERLKLLGAVMIADYSYEGRIAADVFPIIDKSTSFAYILADIATKVLETDLRYTDVPNARTRLQKELAEIVKGGI